VSRTSTFGFEGGQSIVLERAIGGDVALPYNSFGIGSQFHFDTVVRKTPAPPSFGDLLTEDIVNGPNQGRVFVNQPGILISRPQIVTRPNTGQSRFQANTVVNTTEQIQIRATAVEQDMGTNRGWDVIDFGTLADTHVIYCDAGDEVYVDVLAANPSDTVIIRGGAGYQFTRWSLHWVCPQPNRRLTEVAW
jgi:hypothetical protein